MNEDVELIFCLVSTELAKVNDLRVLGVHCCQIWTVAEAKKVKIAIEKGPEFEWPVQITKFAKVGEQKNSQ